MRYSITNATANRVESIGAKNIRAPRRVPVIFADLTDAQVQQLRSEGCIVKSPSKVVAGTMLPPIAPPTPTPVPEVGAELYTPSQLSTFAEWEKLRDITDPPLYGLGYNLAIIDTGIRETHELVASRVVYRKNFSISPMQDGYDHGTGVASIVAAIAPLCNILNMKALDDEGNGTEEEVVAAIDECIELQETNPEIAPTVINLSLGSTDEGDPDAPMRVACRTAIETGVIVIAAAGNGGPAPSTIMSPACERYVGAVGSADISFAPSDLSSRGPTREGLVKPDVIIFGENIVMASSESDTATAAKSGTSFSAPMAAASVMMFQEGAVRKVEFAPLGGVGPLVNSQELLDDWVPIICVRPEGISVSKDNESGWGLPFGDLIIAAFQPVPGVGTILSQAVPMIVAMGMMGLMAKIMR